MSINLLWGCYKAQYAWISWGAAVDALCSPPRQLLYSEVTGHSSSAVNNPLAFKCLPFLAFLPVRWGKLLFFFLWLLGKNPTWLHPLTSPLAYKHRINNSKGDLQGAFNWLCNNWIYKGWESSPCIMYRSGCCSLIPLRWPCGADGMPAINLQSSFGDTLLSPPPQSVFAAILTVLSFPFFCHNT